MPTNNLTVYWSNYDATTLEMTCLVNPTAPLYIYELIIEAIAGLGAPQGTVRPGTAQHPVLRTIYLDASNPVFQAHAPFTLAITYDAGTYRVTDVHLVPSVMPTFAPFDPILLSGLNAEETAVFVTQVLQAAAPVLIPPEEEAFVRAAAPPPDAEQSPRADEGPSRAIRQPAQNAQLKHPRI